MPRHQLQTHIEDVRITGRLIIIGDVHGHLAELQDLLQKVSFDKENGDALIFVGDLINKGPDSPGVVQLAIDLGARAVRGNNEDRVLTAHAAIKEDNSSLLTQRLERLAIQEEEEKGAVPLQPSVSLADQLKSLSLQDLKPYHTKSHFGTAASLTDEQISWLSSRPLIIRIELRRRAATSPWNSGTLLVAHGGLVPSLPLEEQDPWAVMNMRGLVYPAEDADTTETIRIEMLRAVKSRTRRFAAFQDATNDDISAELARLSELAKHGEGFENHQYKDGLIGYPLESREGEWWIKAWNRWQNSIEEPGQRSIVVYGHDAKIGLQVGPSDVSEGSDDLPRSTWFTFGLDSGCVYGNSLTAMVVHEKVDGAGLTHTIVQVEASKKAV